MVTKAARDVPAVMVWFAAALLQVAQVHTGWIVTDEFCARFVYFHSGYVLAPYVFAFAANVFAHQRDALLFLAAWALFEAVMVFGGYSELPVVGLGLGFFGALAVVAVSTLLSTRDWARPLRYAGENSIAVYLAFFLPCCHADRALEIRARSRSRRGRAYRYGGRRPRPLTFIAAVQNTQARFLFERPSWLRLEPAPRRPHRGELAFPPRGTRLRFSCQLRQSVT